MGGKGSVVGRICGKGVFSLEWKRVEVMDGESGDDDGTGEPR